MIMNRRHARITAGFVLMGLCVMLATTILFSSRYASAQSPDEPTIFTNEIVVREMIHRWFGPHLASTTPASFNPRPGWYLSVIRKDPFHIKSNAATSTNKRIAKFGDFLSSFGQNTFGISRLIPETFEQPRIRSWWQRIADLFSRLWAAL